MGSECLFLPPNVPMSALVVTVNKAWPTPCEGLKLWCWRGDPRVGWCRLAGSYHPSTITVWKDPRPWGRNSLFGGTWNKDL